MRDIKSVLSDKSHGLKRISGDGNYGNFTLDLGPKSIACIVSAGGNEPEEKGWEHVSAHCRYLVKRGKKAKWKTRMPRWEEMCRIKALFFLPEECVVQFHPPESDYVNIHDHVLHLWRSRNQAFPMPPKWMI